MTLKIPLHDIPQRVDDNSLAPFNLDNLCCTVWRAAVVDESCNTTSLGSVDHCVFINPKQITASDATLQVSSLSHVRYLLPNLLTHVFYDHVISGDVLHGVQTPVV